ncbi:MAG: hypothetical protein CMQ24_22725 [Gammaproteobacteria bacterium]|nr:hypothetical protein [Gammaproteobacteria bacterium]
MAGLGWQQWSTGDTVSAANFQGFLQDQIIQVYASTTARDTANPSPSHGQWAFVTADDTLYYRSSSAWVATSLAADITGITTAANSALAGGATSGDVTLTVDVNNATVATATAADYVLIADTDDSNATRKALISDITALAGDITEVTAGTAISGGGSSGAVTVNVDVNGASVVTGTSTDYILIEDVTDNTTKKCLASDIASDPIPLILALS